MQILEALYWAKSVGAEASDRQILLLHCLGQPTHNKAYLLTHDHDSLNLEQVSRYKDLIHRCNAGEPVAYLTGFKEFFGLEFKVNSATLIPRPDTETLVNWVLETVAQGPKQPFSIDNILDLGTGSGCIAISLKKYRPQANVWATDLSEDALNVAVENAARHQVKVNFGLGAWFNALGTQASSLTFELIVSNPPYIEAEDSHLANLLFEPKSALVGGLSGLEAFKEIMETAPKHLSPGGWLLFEHGYNQGETIQSLFAEYGFEFIQSRNDLAGICRCTGARWPINGIIEP